MIELECKKESGKRVEKWMGKLWNLSATRGRYEFEAERRGSYFHIIAGRYRYGNYICIPNWNIGCELSTFGDLFWNTERLAKKMNKTDAVTVANAVSKATTDL